MDKETGEKSCAKNTESISLSLSLSPAPSIHVPKHMLHMIYSKKPIPPDSSLSSPRVSAKCRVLRPPRDAPSYDVAHGFWAMLVAHEASVKLDFWMATVCSPLSWDERMDRTAKMLESNIRRQSRGLWLTLKPSGLT